MEAQQKVEMNDTDAEVSRQCFFVDPSPEDDDLATLMQGKDESVDTNLSNLLPVFLGESGACIYQATGS